MEYILRYFLKNFLRIDFSSVERAIVEDSLKYKYVPALRNSCIGIILCLPAIIFLDTTIIASVLIPATTVAGVAWYSVSLANLKKKFESFGTELTRDLFESLILSLAILFLITVFSLTKPFFADTLRSISQQQEWIPFVSALLGIVVIGRLLLKIFEGSFKYDMNDSLLTGQNEAAERFYKKSLSLLNSTAAGLKSKNNSLQVANYLIGVSFFEVFNFYKDTCAGPAKKEFATAMIEKANALIKKPAMKQEAADVLSRELITSFLSLVRTDITDLRTRKSLTAIGDELSCLTNNAGEDQGMVDTRLSVVFEEMADLLESCGENLFVK